MTSTLSRLVPASDGRNRHHQEPGSTFGLLPIAADLLPRGAVAVRRGRSGRLIALALVLVAVVGVGGWYLLAAHGVSSARTGFTAAQDRQTSLQAEQRSYTDLVQTQALTTALSAQLTTLMASDLPWSQLLPTLGGIRGAITFTSVAGALTDPATAVAPTTTSASPVDPDAVGTLTISGTAADKPTIAAFVDALGATTGLANPFVTNVSQTGDAGSFSFTVQADLTSALRATAPGRWATATGGGK